MPHRAKRFNPEAHMALYSHVCLMLFQSGRLSPFFRDDIDFHDLDVFENYMGVILWDALQFEFASCFLMIGFRLSVFGRNIKEVMLCSSQRTLSGGTQFHFIMLLGYYLWPFE